MKTREEVMARALFDAFGSSAGTEGGARAVLAGLPEGWHLTHDHEWRERVYTTDPPIHERQCVGCPARQRLIPARPERWEDIE